jgi:hypothetical protein
MKKTLLIVFLLIPFFGFSQTTKPIDGFLGIKFGSSKAIVLAAIKAKGGVVDKANSNLTQIAFNNVKLGHRLTSGFLVRFVNDKACNALFVFSTTPEDKTIDYYNDLLNDINDIYGSGESTKTFRTPFKDGDGYEITAIKEGDADYVTNWNSGKNSIQMSINTDLMVKLTYFDGVLTDMRDAQKKAKESSDF